MSTKQKVVWIIVVSFLIQFLIVLVGINVYSKMPSKPETTGTTLDTIRLDDETLIILFTHAGDDAEGNPVEKQIYIQSVIRDGDIPSYNDKEQCVIVTCPDRELLDNGKAALTSMGYTNIEEL